jgi:tubulin-specific chaperone D
MVQIEDYKDDDMPSNTLEHFTDYDEVIKMIAELPTIYEKNFEKSYEKYSEILSKYQEQPHLLDSNIIQLIQQLLEMIRDEKSTDGLVHSAFKYLYQICKVRTFKVFVKFLPHELSDIDFVLNLLETQNVNESLNWETRYLCLLWMSILVLNPFHMSRLDATSSIDSAPVKTKMERIYQVCKDNCKGNDTCSTVAAYLSAKFLIRNEIKDIYLSAFFDWAIIEVHPDDLYIRYGTLLAIAAILKQGKREDILPYASKILQWLLAQNFTSCQDYLKNKYYVKIIQRLGLTFLPPKIAQWRYNRGSRSLQANMDTNLNLVEYQSTNLAVDIEEEDIEVPDEVEEVIEQLLLGLKSPSSDVRWLAAKGIGRVTMRLPKSLGDEVVGSVIEILNPLEQHEAWHGKLTTGKKQCIFL